MITTQEYERLKHRSDKYEASIQTFYPKIYSLTEEMIDTAVFHAQIDRPPTNQERSQIEVYEFVNNPPDKYFLYINQEKRQATTWTGDLLGTVTFGNEWCDNFGGKRVPVTIRAVNNKTYHGTYYKSAGDYARVKINKA